MKYPDFINNSDIQLNLIYKFEINYLYRSKTVSKINSYIHNSLLSINIENSIFEYSILYILNEDNNIINKNKSFKFLNDNFLRIYINKADSIFRNLKDNKKLLDKLKNKIIDASNLAFISFVELNPNVWADELLKKQKREKNNEHEYSTVYKCPKCKNKKCVTQFFTNRASDEPLALSITCIECGYVFYS